MCVCVCVCVCARVCVSGRREERRILSHEAVSPIKRFQDMKVIRCADSKCTLVHSERQAPYIVYTYNNKTKRKEVLQHCRSSNNTTDLHEFVATRLNDLT